MALITLARTVTQTVVVKVASKTYDEAVAAALEIVNEETFASWDNDEIVSEPEVIETDLD